MLYFNRIDVSEGIHVNKTSESKERDVCYCWYFLDEGFKFQSVNLSDIDILNIENVDYHCIISEKK